MQHGQLPDSIPGALRNILLLASLSRSLSRRNLQPTSAKRSRMKGRPFGISRELRPRKARMDLLFLDRQRMTFWLVKQKEAPSTTCDRSGSVVDFYGHPIDHGSDSMCTTTCWSSS